MSILTRRSLLRGLFAAPAVVAAASLMPISAKLLPPPPLVVPDNSFVISGEAYRLGYAITRKAIAENLYGGISRRLSLEEMFDAEYVKRLNRMEARNVRLFSPERQDPSCGSWR